MRCDMDLVRHNDLAEALGIQQLSYWGECGPGGVAPCAMVGQAVGAILSGQAATVVVFRALNGRSGRRYGAAPTAPGQADRRRQCLLRRVLPAVRAAHGWPDVRPDGSAAHDRVRLDAGAAWLDRDCLPGPGPGQPGRADVWPPAHHGRVPIRADDLLPATALRLLPGDRRRCRPRGDQRRTGPRLPAGRRAHPRRGAGQPCRERNQERCSRCCMRDSITSLSSRAVADLLWSRSGLGPGRRRRRPAL